MDTLITASLCNERHERYLPPPLYPLSVRVCIDPTLDMLTYCLCALPPGVRQVESTPV